MAMSHNHPHNKFFEISRTKKEEYNETISLSKKGYVIMDVAKLTGIASALYSE